jgi:hypothetical protein
MFENNKDIQNKSTFLKQTEDARQKRLLEKKKQQSALKIQSYFRGYSSRTKLAKSIHEELNSKFMNSSSPEVNSNGKPYASFTSSQLLDSVKKYLFIYKMKYGRGSSESSVDLTITKNILEHLTCSIVNGDFKYSYVSLIMSKANYQVFINQSRELLSVAICVLNILNIKNVLHLKVFLAVLELVSVLSESNKWKCFKSQENALIDTLLKETEKSYLKNLLACDFFAKLNLVLIQNSMNYHPILDKKQMNSILCIIFKAMEARQFDEMCINEFTNQIITVPLILDFLHKPNELDLSQIKQKIIQHDLLAKTLVYLSETGERMKSFIASNKDINYLIFALGNLCSLAKFSFESLRDNTKSLLFVSSQIFLSQSSVSTLGKRKKGDDGGSTIRWHPIFGFLKVKSAFSNFEIIMSVMDQLRWVCTCLFLEFWIATDTVFVDKNLFIYSKCIDLNFPRSK